MFEWWKFFAGMATAYAILGIIKHKEVAEFIREEYRYRKGGYYVWRIQRKERKEWKEESVGE